MEKKYLEIRCVEQHALASVAGWELIEIRDESVVMHTSVSEPHPRLASDPNHWEKTVLCHHDHVGTKLKFVFGRTREDYIESLQKNVKELSNALTTERANVEEANKRAMLQATSAGDLERKLRDAEAALEKKTSTLSTVSKDNEALLGKLKQTEHMMQRAQTYFGAKGWSEFLKSDEAAMKEKTGGKGSS